MNFNDVQECPRKPPAAAQDNSAPGDSPQEQKYKLSSNVMVHLDITAAIQALPSPGALPL
jgi:hypothetical protein